MSPTNKPVITPIEVFRILREHPKRWIAPLVAVPLLAMVYAVLRPVSWEASQALMARDEAMGANARPGKFQQPDDMKTTQETILELAHSRSVLSAALAEVGPDSKSKNVPSWPTDAAVAALQGHVKLVPPKGAEFGKTEVFYLNVEAENRQRAVDLAAAICRQLQLRSQELRNQKAQSLIAELSKTVDLAKTDLNSTTEELTAIESRVGADLGELRMLNDLGGGDSPLRRSINEMDQELRQAQQAIDGNQELLSLLQVSKTDGRSLASAPNRLLEAQPELRRLKDGLVDAQLRTSQLLGNLTADHPSVVAAKIAEQEIADKVRAEIDSAIVGVQSDLRLSQARADLLKSQLNDARQRLSTLAGMRAEYANLVAERNQRADILKTAEQELAESRASQAAALTASLIAAIDAPVAGDSPVGPGKTTIVLGGILGGLLLGLGIVFLTVNPTQSEAVRQATQSQPLVGAEIPPLACGEFSPVEGNGHPVRKFASHRELTSEHEIGGRDLSLKQALRKLTPVR
ncbi:MAG TPA: hypothetical protein VMJ32_16565 [Pirellulales bacterium]|nr:hypothetical protein [Pirellulales bacterium]